VHTRTLANLTHAPPEKLVALIAVLRGTRGAPQHAPITIIRTRPHGHVHALLTTLRRIGLDDLIASKPCRERSIIMALIVERLLHGTSKLAATRLWHTTLAEESGLAQVGVNEVYAAMDWLVARQKRIEKKLHLGERSALYCDRVRQGQDLTIDFEIGGCV